MRKASLKGLHRETPFNLAKELLKDCLACGPFPGLVSQQLRLFGRSI
jgi:hypothetical protein